MYFRWQTLIFLSIVSLNTIYAQQAYDLVEEKGHLMISGTSNTSNWSLEANNLLGSAKVKVNDGVLVDIEELRVALAVSGLENKSNKRMTNKAEKLLKMKEFPLATFFAYDFEPSEDHLKKIKGVVYLGGQLVDMDFTFSSNYYDGTLWVVGRAETTFTAFNMEPPKDFGGVIKCNDEISIVIQLPLQLNTAK